jgi:hypothetical protein
LHPGHCSAVQILPARAYLEGYHRRALPSQLPIVQFLRKGHVPKVRVPVVGKSCTSTPSRFCFCDLTCNLRASAPHLHHAGSQDPAVCCDSGYDCIAGVCLNAICTVQKNQPCTANGTAHNAQTQPSKCCSGACELPCAVVPCTQLTGNVCRWVGVCDWKMHGSCVLCCCQPAVFERQHCRRESARLLQQRLVLHCVWNLPGPEMLCQNERKM